MKIDLTGQRFGKLTVLAPEGDGNWRARCDCGGTTTTYISRLRSGKTRSCGECNQREMIGRRFGARVVIAFVGRKATPHGNGEFAFLVRCDCGDESEVLGTPLRRGGSSACRKCSAIQNAVGVTHGMSISPTYNSWRSMIKRCTDPKNHNYPKYGGRGIQICQRWRHSFENFFEDMGERPPGNYSIDRKNNDGHYEPGNCRWATAKEQSRNRRDNIKITFNGVTLCIAEWVERTGLSHNLILKRFHAGWLAEKIFTTPSQHP